MKRILTIALCLLFVINAQADSIRKFDEYRKLPFSDEIPRLDNIAIQLQQEPDMIAWFIIYAGQKACVGETRSRAIRAKNYIVSKRGIQADRIMWIDGGYREELTVEIWLLPRRLGRPYAFPSIKPDDAQIMNCKQKIRIHRRRGKSEPRLTPH
jgi:hypothetical protein